MRRTIEISLTPLANQGGYVLWFPQYSCLGSLPTGGVCFPGNLFTYVGDPTRPNENTPEEPWGNTASPSWLTQQDPAYFDVSNRYRDHRVIAACMEVIYTGRSDAASGTVCTLPEVPLAGLWYPSAATDVDRSAAYQEFRVDDLFSTANDSARFEGEARVTYAPTAGSCKFNPVNHSPILLGHALGTATATTVSSEHVREDQPTGMAIAWRNGSDVSPIIVRLTKVFEVRENQARWGLGRINLTGAKEPDPTPSGRIPVVEAAKALSARLPSWQTLKDGAARALAFGNALTGGFEGELARTATKLLGGLSVGKPARGYRAITASRP